MVRKRDRNSVGISLPKEFVKIIDEIISKYTDFKTRSSLIRFAVRKYYDELGFRKK